MKLEDIGFYTLSDYRAAQASAESPMWRCEILLTGRCNFKCPYCRGLPVLCGDLSDMDFEMADETIRIWCADGLRNIRFSGGEPTLYDRLPDLVAICKANGVARVAVSTNGSRPWAAYKNLIRRGVDDFSVSLDACCASAGGKMAGVQGKWKTVVDNIRRMSSDVYVTVGVVLTEDNVQDAKEIIEFAHGLGVADIRIISAAQYNAMVDGLSGISEPILDAHPALKYRIEHFAVGRNVRGIEEYDTHKCYLVWDDSVVAGAWHFPCVIYLREGGQPIGQVGPNMREERMRWHATHDSFRDEICRQNCLDVYVDYNNRCAMMRAERAHGT